MSLEIRPITEDEFERAEFITAYSFNEPAGASLRDRVGLSAWQLWLGAAGC